MCRAELLCGYAQNSVDASNVSGVAPGPKNVPAKPTPEDEKSDENVAACRNYHEAKPGKSFGVCMCGFSRVDHKHITSVLVPGPDEPNFNKAKPKIILSKNSTAPSTTGAKLPAASSSSSQIPNNSKPSSQAPPPSIMSKPIAPVAPIPPSKMMAFNKPVVAPAPIPKFEVKAEGRDGPCSDYRLDLEGRSFGVCKCGWSRPEHYKAKQQVAWAQQNDDEAD